MNKLFADAVEITTNTVYVWNNIPMIVGLLFALAGAFFVSIYYLRRRKR
jgi:hypothetical protein